MRLYLAASSAELDRARLWRDRCVSAGIEVVSTWIESVLRVGASNPRDASRDQRTVWARTCLDEIERLRREDAFWLLWPTVKTETGALIELGYMLGAWCQPGPWHHILISGDTKRSIFCALGREYATDEEAFAAIVAEASTKRKEME